MDDEHQQEPRRRPSRRALLATGAAIGGGAIAGTVVTLAHHRKRQDGSSTTTPPAPPPTSVSPWSTRDDRFLAMLHESTETLSLANEYEDAFPSLKIREVLPLSGLGDKDMPWTAAAVIGPSNQLQITRSGETSPHLLLDIPSDPPAEILSMAWDTTSRVLYLSAGGKIWAWREAAPKAIELLADVPGATALYELLIDPKGLVWGGTYPLGAVFTFDPSNRAVSLSSQLASDSDYVRRLTMDTSGQLWAGTGARNPRIFMFPRTATGSRIEMQLPEPLESGFITAIRAGSSKVRVTTDGQPDVFELDMGSRTWTRQFAAAGWVRTPSSSILLDDTYYMIKDGALIAYRGTTSATVAEVASAIGTTVHLAGSSPLISTLSPSGFSLTRVSSASEQGGQPGDVTLEPGVFKVQSILAPEDGNVYVGGFMGTGIAGIAPSSKERWQSPVDLDVIDQIENMISVGDRLYLGTYSWADVISCEVGSRDQVASYERIARFSSKYHQSRPYGLATNSSSLFVGTVPNYGLSGGILAKIDMSSNTTDWVLDGDGEGFISGHSIVGLAADEEYVYGTTSIRNGSGVADTEGSAQVFMLDITTKKTIWQTAPVPSTGALYTPKLVAGWLLVADLEGISIIDPRNGMLEASHRLSTVLNTSQRPGWASAALEIIVDGRKIAHSAGGTVTVADFLSATSTRVDARGERDELGPRIAASPAGRLFAARGTDVVEIALQQ